MIVAHHHGVHNVEIPPSPVLPVPDVIAADDACPVECIDNNANDKEHQEVREATARGRSPAPLIKSCHPHFFFYSVF